MDRRREDHREHRQPSGARESPPGRAVARRRGQVSVDRRPHAAPAPELIEAQQPDRRQPGQHHRAVDEVGDRRPPQSAQRDVGAEDRGRDQHAGKHRQRGQGADDDADDVGFDQVDDDVLGLHAEAGQPLAAAFLPAQGEDLADGLQPQPAVVDREEQPHQRQRQERADAVPPEVPDAAADDVAGHAVGAGAADAGPGDAHRHHHRRHPAPGHRPAGRRGGPAGHQAAGRRGRDQVDDDDADRDRVHETRRPGAAGRPARGSERPAGLPARRSPPRRWRPPTSAVQCVIASTMASQAARALARISSSVASWIGCGT